MSANAMSATIGSYDDRQVNAVLKVCVACNLPYYFGDPQRTVCVSCRFPIGMPWRGCLAYNQPGEPLDVSTD